MTSRRIAAVGTAGLRIAPNRQVFLDAVKARTGVDVEVISGEEEGRLAYVAATSALPLARGRLVVFDSGGGSSQFTFGEGSRVDERFSVDVGAVRFAERFGLAGAVARETVDAALTAIADDLTRLDGTRQTGGSDRDGRHGDQPRRREARTRRRTTPMSCTARCWTSPRSTARSSCTASATPSNGEPSRVCNQRGPR